MITLRIELVRKPDGWWIKRNPPHWFRSLGPYETEAKAKEDMRGLRRLLQDPVWKEVIEQEFGPEKETKK